MISIDERDLVIWRIHSTYGSAIIGSSSGGHNEKRNSELRGLELVVQIHI